jgi:ribonucleoside-diphosphate reductase alpha chain
MARRATPEATEHTGHATGNGNGNGHGQGGVATAHVSDEPMAAGSATNAKPSGYHQLRPGERKTWKGISVERRFTREGVDPYDTVEWDTREAVITNEHGKVVFEQRDLEVPRTWSQLATQVTASKYFRGPLGTPERERSVKQMLDRVANTITDWGIKDAYFATDADAEAFRNELKDILLKQRAAFNSPVWCTVGIVDHPLCSACWINAGDDTMESILGRA